MTTIIKIAVIAAVIYAVYHFTRTRTKTVTDPRLAPVDTTVLNNPLLNLEAKPVIGISKQFISSI